MKCILRHAFVFSALALAAASTNVHAQTTITSIPPGIIAGGFGSAYPVFGQTFTVPTDNVLTSFAFQLDPLAPLTLSIFAYDPVTNTTTSAALFTSALTPSGTVLGEIGYNFDTGKLVLNSGEMYVALLTGTPAFTGREVEFTTTNPDPYPGGTIIFGYDTKGPFDYVSKPGLPFDAAFIATFLPASSVPEPSSVALLTGLSLSGTVFLRRRKLARRAA